MAPSGGIGGNPVVGASPCPNCDLQAHASTGWCLAATGDPIVVITTIYCDQGTILPPIVQFVDPATGAPVPLQAIVPCGDRDWEVNQLCDYDPATGDLIATFIQLFEWDEDQGTLTVSLVRADDPNVPYVPVGQVRSCVEREPQIDVEWILLCDLENVEGAVATPFLRRLIYDSYTELVAAADFELDATTPYVPSFNVTTCNQSVIVDITGSPNATVARLTNVGNVVEQCIPANPNRRQLIIVTEGGGSMYMKFGSGISATSYSVIIPANGTYELQINQIYTGQICFLKVTGGTNNIQYTEVTV